MKIYISEKDFDTCGEKIETFNDVDLAVYDKKYGAYDIVETIERGAIITSLEKHEAEIRKQAKQEVVEELLRLVNTLGIIRKSKSFVNGYDFAQKQIKQKLNEMKEGSYE